VGRRYFMGIASLMHWNQNNSQHLHGLETDYRGSTIS
jgi:hypothetical protein